MGTQVQVVAIIKTKLMGAQVQVITISFVLIIATT
jgi:hypothetical protein